MKLDVVNYFKKWEKHLYHGNKKKSYGLTLSSPNLEIFCKGNQNKYDSRLNLEAKTDISH